MKTNLILFVATLLFATSCSNKFSLVKRKYNKGFYVSVNKKAGNVKASEHKALKSAPVKEEVALEVVGAQPANNVKSTEIHTIAVKNAVTKKQDNSSARTSKAVPTFIAAADKSPLTFQAARKSIRTVPEADKNQMGTDSDVNLVLLVILAIILPPLAVYLKHHTIDTWFWVTLILTVLALGLFVGSFSLGGLFGLAAVVIALLYVFDAIK